MLQLGEILVPDISSHRDVFRYKFIQPMEFQFFLCPERLHKYAAADVHSHYVRDDLVSEVTSKAYHAPGSGMNIRHHPDSAAAEHVY